MISTWKLVCWRGISLNFLRPVTIYALSSGLLPSAIAVVRITGPESQLCLHYLTKRKDFEPRKLFYSAIFGNDSELIDRSMAVFLPGPATYTGEDIAEIYLHGSRAVVESLFKALNRIKNVRPAKAGEFTKRAFFNSKMTFKDVNALSHLLSAETQKQHALAIHSKEIGSASITVRSSLLDLLSMLEARIDFADDVDFDWETFVSKIHFVKEELRLLQERVHKGILISNGVRAVIVGRTNVGKSSLLNRVAARDVAIVSPLEGTTRDALEARIEIASCPVIFVDTAGVRETSNCIEAEGIARTRLRVSEANFLLVVLDATTTFNAEEHVNQLLAECGAKDNVKIFVIFNKSDLVGEQPICSLPWKSLFVSCLNNTGIDLLIELIGNEINSAYGKSDTDALLSRERQRILLANAINYLKETLEATRSLDLALVAQLIHNAVDAMGEMTGAIVNEEIINNLFSNFCIGK